MFFSSPLPPRVKKLLFVHLNPAPEFLNVGFLNQGIVCIRALVEIVGEDGSISAFADDIGVFVEDIIRALLVLVLILSSIGAATCLKLYWKKTHIANFYKLTIFQLKRQIEEAVPQALGAEICYFAKYFGFLAGPCAKDHAWDAPCRKLPERARHVKTLGLYLNEAVLAFCVFAFSVIRFSLQLVPLSPALFSHFGLALDICTSSPRYSPGVNVLCSLRRLGMPIEMPDLPSTSKATMYRTAAASEVLDRLSGEVYAARDSGEAVFCPRHHAWIKESTTFNLVKVRYELSSVPGIGTLSGKKIQWGGYGNFKGRSW